MATEKKQQLLDTALRLFVEQGIQATATAKIAKQANVATGTLFHHFANKQELVMTLYHEIKSDLGQAIDQPEAHDDLHALVHHYWQHALQWAVDNPQKLQFLQQIANNPQFGISQQQEVMSASMAFLIDVIKQGQQQGELASLPLDLVLNYCHYHYLATATLFVEQPELARQQAYQDGAFQMFWQGLAAIREQA